MTNNDVPIGTIIPVFLDSDSIKTLEPFWVPADGRTLEDQKSPFNGRVLPDLTGRFPLGLDPAASEDVRYGGSLSINGQFSIDGRTDEGHHTYESPWDYEARNKAGRNTSHLVDTNSGSEKSVRHDHGLSGKYILKGSSPIPPFAAFVFLIKVRA